MSVQVTITNNNSGFSKVVVAPYPVWLGSSVAPEWNNLLNKPSTFPPSAHNHTSSQITDFASAVATLAPSTTNASLLTSGTLADARLSSAVQTSLGKADDALPLAGGALDVDAEVTASIAPNGNGRSVDTEFGGWGFGVEEKIDGTNTGTQATMEPDGFRAGSTIVDETAGVYISSNEVSGNFVRNGDWNFKPAYELSTFQVRHNGDRWYLADTNGTSFALANEGDEAYPWLATWESGTTASKEGGGSGRNTHLSSTALTLDNGAKLRKGTTDALNGGYRGIALECSAQYELKWEAGRLYVLQQDGFTIRRVEHCGTVIPSVNDDSTKGFVIGSQWVLDDGTVYVCTQPTASEAAWVKVFQRNDAGFSVLQDPTSTSFSVSEDSCQFSSPNVAFSVDGNGLSFSGANTESVSLSENELKVLVYNRGINLSSTPGTAANLGGSITSIGGEGLVGGSLAPGGSLTMSGDAFRGGSINTSGGADAAGGNITTSNGGGSIDTGSSGRIELGRMGRRTILTGSALENIAIALPDASGTLALSSNIPTASSTTPAALGTAAVGTGTTFARADHVHALPTLSSLGAQATLEQRFIQTAALENYFLPQGRNVELQISFYNSGTKRIILPRSTDGAMLLDMCRLQLETNSGTIIVSQYQYTGSTYTSVIVDTQTIVGQSYTNWLFIFRYGMWTLQKVQPHTHATTDVTNFATAAAAAAPVQSVNGSTGAVTVAVPAASSTTPAALGTAAVGTGTTFARADHVHALPTASAIGAAATSHTQAASTISDSTTVGRAVLTAASEAAARTAIGAVSFTDGFTGSFVQLTQAQYNALVTPSATTLYVIIG
jgi:hypothetical protein